MQLLYEDLAKKHFSPARVRKLKRWVENAVEAKTAIKTTAINLPIEIETAAIALTLKHWYYGSLLLGSFILSKRLKTWIKGQ